MTAKRSAPDNVNTEFEVEKKRIAEEEARIERKRQELEQLKALIERKKKLEAENQRLEEEKLKLASIPRTVTAPGISLRKKPQKITNKMKITNMLKEYGFYESSKNPQGAFENHFSDNNDGTVSDRATGLMWQRTPCEGWMDFDRAREAINDLNVRLFAGSSGWPPGGIGVVMLRSAMGCSVSTVSASGWNPPGGIGIVTFGSTAESCDSGWLRGDSVDDSRRSVRLLGLR